MARDAATLHGPVSTPAAARCASAGAGATRPAGRPLPARSPSGRALTERLPAAAQERAGSCRPCARSGPFPGRARARCRRRRGRGHGAGLVEHRLRWPPMRARRPDVAAPAQAPRRRAGDAPCRRREVSRTRPPPLLCWATSTTRWLSYEALGGARGGSDSGSTARLSWSRLLTDRLLSQVRTPPGRLPTRAAQRRRSGPPHAGERGRSARRGRAARSTEQRERPRA